MDVELDAKVPLFSCLAEFCARVEGRGRHLRLIGGAAMLLWGRTLAQPRDMTEDLDCALLKEDLPDAMAAEQLARETTLDLRDLGFTRPDDWRASRKGRFSYSHSTHQVAVEFLCGDLAVGEASRREPAWRIAPVPGGPPDFYAARVPWLEFVTDWIPVRTRCGTRVFHPWVPDLSGLAVLKLRAVADKTRRLDEEPEQKALEFEKLRLRRHAQDCSMLFEWIDRQGEFDRLARLHAEHEEIRSTVLEVARWMLGHDHEVEQLGLRTLGRSLERLVPTGA